MLVRVLVTDLSMLVPIIVIKARISQIDDKYESKQLRKLDRRCSRIAKSYKRTNVYDDLICTIVSGCKSKETLLTLRQINTQFRNAVDDVSEISEMCRRVSSYEQLAPKMQFKKHLCTAIINEDIDYILGIITEDNIYDILCAIICVCSFCERQYDSGPKHKKDKDTQFCIGTMRCFIFSPDFVGTPIKWPHLDDMIWIFDQVMAVYTKIVEGNAEDARKKDEAMEAGNVFAVQNVENYSAFLDNLVVVSTTFESVMCFEYLRWTIRHTLHRPVYISTLQPIFDKWEVNKNLLNIIARNSLIDVEINVRSLKTYDMLHLTDLYTHVSIDRAIANYLYFDKLDGMKKTMYGAYIINIQTYIQNPYITNINHSGGISIIPKHTSRYRNNALAILNHLVKRDTDNGVYTPTGCVKIIRLFGKHKVKPTLDDALLAIHKDNAKALAYVLKKSDVSMFNEHIAHAVLCDNQIAHKPIACNKFMCNLLITYVRQEMNKYVCDFLLNKDMFAERMSEVRYNAQLCLALNMIRMYRIFKGKDDPYHGELFIITPPANHELEDH
jgi:hypothetical protein